VLDTLIENESLVLNGVGYFTSGYDVTVSYNGILASQVVVESSFKIVAIWELGVPIVAKAIKPELNFTVEGSAQTYSIEI